MIRPSIARAPIEEPTVTPMVWFLVSKGTDAADIGAADVASDLVEDDVVARLMVDGGGN